MERVANLLWALLGLTLLYGAQGRWLGSIQGPLPPCGPGGVPGFDCYDPPDHPLPPCDFKHQRIGFDCSGWPPANHVSEASPATPPATSKSKTQQSFGHELPPCSSVPGGIPGWDCYDPPTHPLPPCDFQHQRIGFDCSGWPPASDAVTSGAPSRATFRATSKSGIQPEGELPPCSQVWGGIPGWDCYDPPTHPLPPCDFQHQKIGFDCSGWPPASHVGEASPATPATAPKSKTPQSFGHELPPCSQVWGGIPGWDCYDPPTHPLPPCDFQHQRIGFDCSGWPPAAGH